MENEFEHTDALIAKFLAGEAGREERAELEAWLSRSDENRQRLNDSKKLMDAVNFSVNTDAAWNQLDRRISTGTAKIVPLYKRTQVLRVAAAVLLLAGLGIIASLFLNAPAAPPLVLAAAQQPVQQKLPDGSTVFMNKHSELSYETARDGSRKVSLKGEAFFEVVHDEKKPFVVSVDDIMIKDIGTAFNVKALPGAESIEVTVESGEVQFYTSSNEGLHLIKGEKATYYLASKKFTKSEPAASENTASYKTKLFRFSETPLQEVVAQVNSVYDTDIRVMDEATGKLRVSVVFDQEEPAMIVNILAETLDLEVEKTAGIILLRRKISN